MCIESYLGIKGFSLSLRLKPRLQAYMKEQSEFFMLFKMCGFASIFFCYFCPACGHIILQPCTVGSIIDIKVLSRFLVKLCFVTKHS